MKQWVCFLLGRSFSLSLYLTPCSPSCLIRKSELFRTTHLSSSQVLDPWKVCEMIHILSYWVSRIILVPNRSFQKEVQFSSVQFSRSVVSKSLRPHESQHARPPCPSPTPGVHPDSRPSSQWCHPAISFSVFPFSSCPQSLPASESFPMSQLFAWGGQSTGVSALASFIPKKSQGWSPPEWTGWISLQSKGLSRVQKHQFFGTQLSSQSNSHIHTWPQEKP